jgi:radical SAM protein with 4Fe4S-binding SPASM domain
MAIIDYCGERDVRIVGILGGEPFVRAGVCLDVMRRIKRYGMDGSVVTNGTLLDRRAICELIKMEWDLVRFSIDGLERTHDWLRGRRGSFRQAIRAIRQFVQLKRRMAKAKPALEINLVLCDRNYQELSQVVQLAADLACDHVYILPMLELTDGSHRLRISDIGRARRCLAEARELSDKLGISTNLSQIIEQGLVRSDRTDQVILPPQKMADKEYIPCFLPWYTLNIDALGEVTPCCNLSAMGENVRKKSLDEIWQGEKFDRLRAQMRERRLPSDCSRCCVPLIDENRALREIVHVGR